MNDVNFVGGEVLPETNLAAPAAVNAAAADVIPSPLDVAAALVNVLADPAPVAAPAGPNGFELLGLAPELVKAVADMGYTEPTAVQNKAIPMALNTGKGAVQGSYADLMVSSQTGSGKTAAFLLPVLHTLLKMQEAEAQAEKDAYDQACADAAAKGEAPPKRAKRKDPTNPRNFKPAVPCALPTWWAACLTSCKWPSCKTPTWWSPRQAACWTCNAAVRSSWTKSSFW